LKKAVYLTLLFFIWLLMMLFSHDLFVAKLNHENQKIIELIESGQHDFKIELMTLDDVIKSFQQHWQQVSTGLIAQSDRPEASIELNGFIITPQIHSNIRIDANVNQPINPGVFKIEFSNQTEQLYYDSNEISLNQLSAVINLHDLRWTLNDLKDNSDLKIPIEWSAVGQIDAWVIRFYPVHIDRVNFAAVTVMQSEPKVVPAEQRVSCADAESDLSLCLVNNNMRYFNHSATYQSGFNAVTFNRYVTYTPWLLALLAWALMMISLILVAKPEAKVYLMVSAVFVAVILLHQKWVYAHFEVFSWLLIPMLLILIWFQRSSLLSPKSHALPVWIISGLVVFVYWTQNHFNTDFMAAFPKYFLWASVQQLLIGPVFSSALKNNMKTSNIITACAVGVLFSIIHTPNHVLMLATLLAGVIWSYAWLRYENIYANAFSHTLLALVFYQVMPEAWLGSARIGVFF
jgi:hypothetical protein